MTNTKAAIEAAEQLSKLLGAPTENLTIEKIPYRTYQIKSNGKSTIALLTMNHWYETLLDVPGHERMSAIRWQVYCYGKQVDVFEESIKTIMLDAF